MRCARQHTDIAQRGDSVAGLGQRHRGPGVDSRGDRAIVETVQNADGRGAGVVQQRWQFGQVIGQFGEHPERLRP
ncbi:hypothetical protein [Kibdelosporangium aridum]|uniref:hypothetical protein n=1 Tax=Kibdelosporangium aridum TaxID=2030 RepID=UPI00068E8627|nr:hypothetical protein [Kibdelosporangium aridum]